MRRLDVTSSQAGNLRSRVATCFLTSLSLLAPLQIRGQCQPAVQGKAKPADAQSASASPQFYDEPQFTVAGVADTTNLGGHGSDTVVRTKEALAKDTVSLGKAAASDSSRSGGGKSPAALSDLELAARRNPDDYETASALARAYVNAGKYEDARTRTHALLARPDLAVRNQADLHHVLGDVEEKLNHPLEAVREYQRAAELDPSEPYLFDWGAELLAHRAPEPAMEVFAKGNRLFPRSTRMLIGLGVSWHARGAYEQAIQCLCQASDVNPSDPAPYLFLGKMRNAETIQSKDVVERLERFARLQPENALANYYYAVALSKQADGTEEPAGSAHVQLLLEKAIHLDPKLGLAHLQLGILYADRGDFRQAILSYQHAVEADPRMEEPHYRLAQTYRRVGEKAKAQRELQLYEQLSKKTAEEVERERHEIQQFVFSLRDQGPASTPQPQP
jgi:tetratricopeptide (TPR) repeat protein